MVLQELAEQVVHLELAEPQAHQVQQVHQVHQEQAVQMELQV
jgi:hypothetical protein